MMMPVQMTTLKYQVGKYAYWNQNMAKNFFKNIIVISVIVMVQQLGNSNFLNILQGRPLIVNQIT